MLLSLCIVILSLYFIQWMKWHTIDPAPKNEYLYIPDCTVVVPFRNEEENLPILLTALQKNLPDQWRIILVNDHSDDDSCKKVAPFLNLRTQLITAKGQGKKRALRTGIELAHSEWIITMDADLQLSDHWESNLFQADWGSDMIIFSIEMDGEESVIETAQKIEFSIFQYLTQKTCYRGQAQLSNGAYFGFRRKSFIQVGGYDTHAEISSGDDQFMLAYFRQHDKKITFHNTEGKARILGLKQFRPLLQQRLRWAEKSKDLPLRDMQYLGIITLLANAVALVLPWIINPTIWIGLLLLKWLPEYYAVSPILRKRHPLFTIFFLITYPIWVLTVGIGVLIFPIEWKGRRLNQS